MICTFFQASDKFWQVGNMTRIFIIIFTIFGPFISYGYDYDTLVNVYRKLPPYERACMDIRHNEEDQESVYLIDLWFDGDLSPHYHKIRCEINGKKLDLFRTMVEDAQGKYRNEFYSYRFGDFRAGMHMSKEYSCAILNKEIDGKTLIEVIDAEIAKIEVEIKIDEGKNLNTLMLESNKSGYESLRRRFESQVTDYYPITNYASECPSAP